MRLRTTVTFWIKKFRSVITVAHGMLGKAIQALERSIVTITFSVKKKEEKEKKKSKETWPHYHKLLPDSFSKQIISEIECRL